jgi:3-hydroxyacyl-[acyl-carrier-protein] dehydratase
MSSCDDSIDAAAVTVSSDLPFGAPLAAVDEVAVASTEGGLRVRATKRINADDPYLAAHFPSMTVFPGVFIIEAVRQAVLVAIGCTEATVPDIRLVRSARFVAPLFPGDMMSLETTVTRSDDGTALQVDALCWRSDGVTAARVRLEMGPLGSADA